MSSSDGPQNVPRMSSSDSPQHILPMHLIGPADFSEATEYGDTGTTSAWWSDVRLEPPWNEIEVKRLLQRHTKWFQWQASLLGQFKHALEEMELPFKMEIARGLVKIPDPETAEMILKYRDVIEKLQAEAGYSIRGLVGTVNRARTLIGLSPFDIDDNGGWDIWTVVRCAVMGIQRRIDNSSNHATVMPPIGYFNNHTPGMPPIVSYTTSALWRPIPPLPTPSHRYPDSAAPGNTPGAGTTQVEQFSPRTATKPSAPVVV